MDLDELRELFSDMLNKGLRPLLCVGCQGCA